MNILKVSFLSVIAFVGAISQTLAEVLDTELFTKKSVLTVSGYSGTSTLENFPVLVRLSENLPEGFNYADVTNGDIRFADANGNSLPFEIEKWDASGESHIWVSVPTLSGTDTSITMYYGAISGKLPSVDSAGVWKRAGYQNVLHYSDASGYMNVDSTENNLIVSQHGTFSSVDASGVLGSSLANVSSGMNGLGVALNDNWAWAAGGTVTFSAWGKRVSDTSDRYLFGTSGAFGYANGNVFTANVNGTTVSGTIPSVGDWTLYTIVIDGSTFSLYIDGALIESKGCESVAATAALYWGSNGSSRWKGSVDESRLRNVADTPDWVKASYDTIKSDNFIVAAAVEANASTAPTFTNNTTGTPLDASKFTSRLPLTIAGYEGSDAIENLPVLVRLGSVTVEGFDVSMLASDGSNFRFADALGNNLPFEIDTWDATSGKNVWVTVPYIEGKDTVIYLYYDTLATLDANDPIAVWTSAGYKNVMHYQSSMDSIGRYDSTGINSEIAAAQPTVIGTNYGKIGDGLSCFESNSKGYQFSLGDAAWNKGEAITFSTWAYETDGDRPIFGDPASSGLYCVYATSSGHIQINRNGGDEGLALVNGNSAAKWCFYTFVCDGAVTKVYANGVYEGMVATPLPVMSNFAWGYANGGRHKGYCDESRIHAVAESADFIAASYKTMTDASFVVAGEVEPAMTSYKPEIISMFVVGNTVEMKGRITAFNEGATSVSMTLKYGLSADALTETVDLESIESPCVFTKRVTKLSYQTTYYAQIVAIDNNGAEALSEVMSFTTGVDKNLDTSCFLKKCEIEISGYSGTTTLANFPVLVKLAANAPEGFDYADCAEGGIDIRFADENGLRIAHEIDTWDPNGTSLVWVQVPSLTGKTTTFSMYYGSTDNTKLAPVEVSDVWKSANYNAVWHFSGGMSESANELVPSDVVGTASYGATTAGLGNGLIVDGSQTFGFEANEKWTTLGEGNTLTVSTWAKYDASTANYARMLSSMSVWTNPAGWELTIQQAVNQITVGSSAQSQFQYNASEGPGANMVYLSAVYNANKDVTLYINGEAKFTKKLNQLVTPTEKLWIASCNKTANRWVGKLDEIRIHRDAESADWIKACYDTMTSDSFVTISEVHNLGGVQPLAVRANDAVQSGASATITGRLTCIGTGATSAEVTLYYGTSPNLEGATQVGPVSYDDKTNLSNVISGLTPAETYYYAYKAVNNAPEPETVWSETKSFVVEASTRFSENLNINVQNCQMTVTGAIDSMGVGVTKVELLVGTSMDNLSVVQTVVLSEAPADGLLAFDSIANKPGTYFVAVRATTTYGDIVWVRETPVTQQTLADTSTYVWKGGTGAWNDSSMWTTDDVGGGGYPTDGCSAIIPGTNSDIVLSNNITLKGLEISSVGKHVLRSTGFSKTYTLKVDNNNASLVGVGGGKLVIDNVIIDSKVTDLAGLAQLVIIGRGRVFPANSETTDILLVNGGCITTGWENKVFGKLILQGGPGRIDCGNYTYSFASLETRLGSGVSAAYVADGKVSFRDPSGIEMVGGTDTLDNPGSQIPVCTQFLIASGNNDQRYGKSLCTIDAEGVVREIPQETMLTSFENATEFDNVCLSSEATLQSDAVVNAVVFSGTSYNLGGHTVTVKSGQFREGKNGLWNCVVSNGTARLMKPNVLGDTTNNADVRMRVDFATEGVEDVLTPMLSHEAVNTGWAYLSNYDDFAGVFSTPFGQAYYLKAFSAPNAVIELRNSILTSPSHYIKSNFGGLTGVGEIDYGRNGNNKWQNKIVLGEVSNEEMDTVEGGRVVVANKGLFIPGLISYEGGRKGSIRFDYNAQGDIPMLSEFLMKSGGIFGASLHSDGSSTYLDASNTKIEGKYLAVTLAGTLAVEPTGKIQPGVQYPIIKYHEGKLTGAFENVTSGYKVTYDVPQSDGSHAVVVERQKPGLFLILR